MNQNTQILRSLRSLRMTLREKLNDGGRVCSMLQRHFSLTAQF
jgi:hypothetical protein